MPPHLISFLGTGNYEVCRYQFLGKTSRPVRYIQLALVELIEPLLGSSSKVSIFLTSQAWEKHWDGNKRIPTEPGLSAILKEGFPELDVKPVPIPEGKSPQELWEIFGILFDQIQEDETLYVDVTHSYRSLPMFGIALLNYARTLKRIHIGGIYYGAIEALGPIDTIKKIAVEDRIAPVFDLTSVYALMEWSTAVHLFLQTGRAEELADLVRYSLKPILSDPSQRNIENVGSQKVADKLKAISLNLLTNRGSEIQRGEHFNHINRAFSDLAGKNLTLKPLEPLVTLIQNKVKGFRENDISNNYRAVEWCIEHGWIQQGITQLQETIITHMLELIQENPQDKDKRKIVSVVFDAKEHPLGMEKYPDVQKKDPHLVHRILKHQFCSIAALPYNKLRDPRNDINHGGFVENTSPDRLANKLTEVFQELKRSYKETFHKDLY